VALNADKQEQDEANKCLYSGLNPNAKIHGMFDKLIKLNYLGSGYILLFNFIKVLWILLSVIIILVIAKLSRYTNGKGCEEGLENSAFVHRDFSDLQNIKAFVCKKKRNSILIYG
jgi:hypothetical protein